MNIAAGLIVLAYLAWAFFSGRAEAKRYPPRGGEGKEQP